VLLQVLLHQLLERLGLALYDLVGHRIAAMSHLVEGVASLAARVG